MIEGYVGRPGSGKTYSMTARALREHRRYRNVYANFPLAIPGRQVEVITPSDLLTIGEGLVLVDEVHMWFSSRSWAKLPPEYLQRLSQTRKAGWTLWWTAQHENRVDTALRANTHWLWLCSAYLSQYNLVADGPALFVARCWEPEKFRKDKPNTRAVRWFSRRVARAYDTKAQIQTADYYLDGRQPAGAGAVEVEERRSVRP